MTRTFPSWEFDDDKRAIFAWGCDKLQAMGATLYIVVEGEDPGFDIFVNGRALARNEDALEKMAQRIGIKPLLEFFSADENSMALLLEEGAGDPEWAKTSTPTAVVFPRGWPDHCVHPARSSQSIANRTGNRNPSGPARDGRVRTCTAQDCPAANALAVGRQLEVDKRHSKLVPKGTAEPAELSK